MRFFCPGMCEATKEMLSCLHQAHIYAASVFRRIEWVPPWLLIYAATVTLSMWMRTDWWRSRGKKAWSDRSTALNSNTLMCGRGPVQGQSPKAVWPKQWPPHPIGPCPD